MSIVEAGHAEHPEIKDIAKVGKSKSKRAEVTDAEAEGELTFGAFGSGEEEAAERPKSEQKQCYFFKKGTCTQGAKCKFSHAADDGPVKVVNAGKGGKGRGDQTNKQEQLKPSGKGGKGNKGGKGKVVQQEATINTRSADQNSIVQKDGSDKYKTYEKGCFICGDNHSWKNEKFHNDAERKAHLELLRKQRTNKSNGAAAAGDNNSDE
jgi:hypothetical protein